MGLERQKAVADEKAIDTLLGPNVDTTWASAVPRDPASSSTTMARCAFRPLLIEPRVNGRDPLADPLEDHAEADAGGVTGQIAPEEAKTEDRTSWSSARRRSTVHLHNWLSSTRSESPSAIAATRIVDMRGRMRPRNQKRAKAQSVSPA